MRKQEETNRKRAEHGRTAARFGLRVGNGRSDTSRRVRYPHRLKHADSPMPRVDHVLGDLQGTDLATPPHRNARDGDRLEIVCRLPPPAPQPRRMLGGKMLHVQAYI